MGTMALSSIVIGASVTKATAHIPKTNDTINNTSNELEQMQMSIAVSVSFLAGIFLVIMSMLRLGFVVSYMAEPFVSGYLAATNIRVLTHQVRQILGVPVGKYVGFLEYFYLLYDILRNILETNLIQLLMSAIAITILFVVKKFINERFRSKLKVPIPIDLIVLIIATAISYFCKLEERFNVKILKKIPQGFPAPLLPSVAHMTNFAFDAFMLAVVSYMMVAMMAKVFSQRHNYAVDNNQEMLANGAACIGGSFFGSLAPSTSPPRCFLMEASGGHTQVAYLVSAALVLVTQLFIAPLFEALPNCILGCVIIIACIPLFVHYTAWLTYWKTDRYDFSIWMVTCIVNLLIPVDIGLLIGVGFSLIVVHFRMQQPQSQRLALNDKDFIFLDSGRIQACSPPGGSHAALFRFEAPIYFATIDVFKERLFASTISLSELRSHANLVTLVHKTNACDINSVHDANQLDIEKVDDSVLGDMKSADESNVDETNIVLNEKFVKREDDCDGDLRQDNLISQANEHNHDNEMMLNHHVDVTKIADQDKITGDDVHDVSLTTTETEATTVKYIILDCSAVPFVDTSGAKTLAILHGEYRDHGVTMVLAGCCGNVIQQLKNVRQCDGLVQAVLYPSVQDAVLALGVFESNVMAERMQFSGFLNHC